LFYFPFWILENNEIDEKKLKKATLGISREIWCSNRETGRFDEKLGDSRENRESWQVCNRCVMDVVTTISKTCRKYSKIDWNIDD